MTWHRRYRHVKSGQDAGWCWSVEWRQHVPRVAIRHKGKAKGACGGRARSPVPAAPGVVFKVKSAVNSGNLCHQVIANSPICLHHMGRVTRFGSKLDLQPFCCAHQCCSAAKCFCPSAAAASAIPAGCHNHASNQPRRTSKSSVLRASVTVLRFCESNTLARDLHAFPSYVVG